MAPGELLSPVVRYSASVDAKEMPLGTYFFLLSLYKTLCGTSTVSGYSVVGVGIGRKWILLDGEKLLGKWDCYCECDLVSVKVESKDRNLL